jgi:integrase/recombinase XerD
MKTLVLKRFFHRERWRIGLFFDYDEKLSPLIRTIPGIAYSGTNKCWYTNDTETAVSEIQFVLQGHAEIDLSELEENSAFEKSHPPGKKKLNFVSKVMNKDKDDLHEVIPEDDIIPFSRILDNVPEDREYDPVELRLNETDGHISVKFTGHYDQDWIDEIASYGKYRYDKVSQEFLLSWSAVTIDSLSDYFSSRGIEVSIIRSKVPEVLKAIRKETGDEIRSRKLGEEAAGALDLMKKHLDEVRYSDRTSESYFHLLELFFKFYNEKDPAKITNKEVSSFIHEFIIKNGYSASYQNQMISAIKTYYRISGKRQIDWRMFERPKRSRALPKVFSKEEVKRILSSTKNDKHKLLLWLIYSCGLRRTEITNIMLTDLDRKRGILHIREGKGKVDRIVPVSEMVWEKIDQYTGGYVPGRYLFEGQAGGRYSPESVYRVFKEALKKAGIKKDVGVHSLRHSYATHLHESGLDIRYIQELLGHKSTRTTEIYTHVSRRNLSSIRSPIEDLGLK